VESGWLSPAEVRQIAAGNKESVDMHEKLGFVLSNENLYWLY